MRPQLLILIPLATAFVAPPRHARQALRPEPRPAAAAPVVSRPRERVLIPAARIAALDRSISRGARDLGRAVKLWLPFAASVGGGAAALVGLGTAGVGGLTVKAGWSLAKMHTAATLGYTGFAALRYCVFGGDGAYVAQMVDGKLAPSYSAAALAVDSVVKGIIATGDSDDAVVKALAAHPPRAFVIPTDEPNAFAAGRGKRSIVAVTQGLVRRLTADELQAVVAHEIGHVQHADVGHHMQRAAAAAGFAGAMDLGWKIVRDELGLGNKHKKTRKKKSDDDDDEGSALVPGLALMAVGGAQYAAGTLLRLAASRHDEFAADAVAARVVPGGADALARALRKIESAAQAGAPRDVLGAHGGALASCYIANSAAHDAPSRLSDWLRTHPTTDRRVARLRALAIAAPEDARRDDDEPANWGAVILDSLEPPTLG